jgi:hypothetical protein
MGMRQSPFAERSSGPGRLGATGHFLGHVEQEPPVGFIDPAEQATKTTQVASLFSSAAPSDIVRALPLRKIGQLRWLFAVVEELVEGNFHGACQLFESLDRRNSMAIFDARDIAAEKAGAFLDIALREFFCFTKQAKPVTDYHGGHCCMEL